MGLSSLPVVVTLLLDLPRIGSMPTSYCAYYAYCYTESCLLAKEKSETAAGLVIFDDEPSMKTELLVRFLTDLSSGTDFEPCESSSLTDSSPSTPCSALNSDGGCDGWGEEEDTSETFSENSACKACLRPAKRQLEGTAPRSCAKRAKVAHTSACEHENRAHTKSADCHVDFDLAFQNALASVRQTTIWQQFMSKRVAIDGSTHKHTTGGLSIWDAILEKC